MRMVIMLDHDVSERDAAVSVGVDAAVDVLDEIGARRRQRRSDEVEQIADDDLSVAAAVEERAQRLEVLVAQQHAEVDQRPYQRLTRDLSRRAATAVDLRRRAHNKSNKPIESEHEAAATARPPSLTTLGDDGRGQVLSTVDRRPSPVDHTRRPARCTARWAIIGRDAARRAGPSASAETCSRRGPTCIHAQDSGMSGKHR